MADIKKIVVIGPESTGKSTLCEQLAQRFQTIWCPEFAREYLTQWGPSYSEQDLLHIARTQLELEDAYAELAREVAELHGKEIHPYFIDTDMYVMKVWSEYVYDQANPFILEQISSRKYDLYLLCDIDLEWKADPLREYPDIEDRRKLFDIYRELLENQPVPWLTISGSEEQRLLGAIPAVQEILKQ